MKKHSVRDLPRALWLLGAMIGLQLPRAAEAKFASQGQRKKVRSGPKTNRNGPRLDSVEQPRSKRKTTMNPLRALRWSAAGLLLLSQAATAQEPQKEPDQVSFVSSGGLDAETVEIHWNSATDALVYRAGDDRRTSRPRPQEWVELWELLDLMQIWTWKPESRVFAFDDTSYWELELVHGGKRLASKGNGDASRPMGFDEVLEPALDRLVMVEKVENLKSFDELQALAKIIGLAHRPVPEGLPELTAILQDEKSSDDGLRLAAAVLQGYGKAVLDALPVALRTWRNP